MNFNTVAQLSVHNGESLKLSQHLKALSVQNVLVVSDQGILAAGLLDAPLTRLKREGVKATLDTSVQSDPSEHTILALAQHARQLKIDGVVGFGGGSSMDAAKLVALLAHPDQNQTIEQMYGVNQITGSRLPLVQVPTTAGTGSEVTPVAIVTRPDQTKSGVVSAKLIADIALLDASLTLGLPRHITAETGIDAMVHAIEAYTSKRLKNPISDMHAIKALQLIHKALPKTLKNGADQAARSDMLLGACLAGQAFANAPVAAVHALAYPLGARYHLAHGLTNALVLIKVLEFNLSHASSLYAELFAALEPDQARGQSVEKQAAMLIELLQTHISESGIKTRLRDHGVLEEDLGGLARDAMQQTRLLINKPRELSEADARRIYAEVW